MWISFKCFFLALYYKSTRIHTFTSRTPVEPLCMINGQTNCQISRKQHILAPCLQPRTETVLLDLPHIWRITKLRRYQGGTSTRLGVLSLTWQRCQCPLCHHKEQISRTGCVWKVESAKEVKDGLLFHFWGSLSDYKHIVVPKHWLGEILRNVGPLKCQGCYIHISSITAWKCGNYYRCIYWPYNKM